MRVKKSGQNSTFFAKDVYNKEFMIVIFDKKRGSGKRPDYLNDIFSRDYCDFIGFFCYFTLLAKLFNKKSCTVFLYAYYDPPCSKQNALKSG